MNEKYMKIALKQANIALKNDEVPVGAIIVQNETIISQAYNEKEKKNNAIKHAEIIAIEKACNKLKTWHLEDCTIYITLEPCLMCIGAILQSRISKIVYATENSKSGFLKFIVDIDKLENSCLKIEKGICKNEAERLLKQFFKSKRK